MPAMGMSQIGMQQQQCFGQQNGMTGMGMFASGGGMMTNHQSNGMQGVGSSQHAGMMQAFGQQASSRQMPGYNPQGQIPSPYNAMGGAAANGMGAVV